MKLLLDINLDLDADDFERELDLAGIIHQEIQKGLKAWVADELRTQEARIRMEIRQAFDQSHWQTHLKSQASV